MSENQAPKNCCKHCGLFKMPRYGVHMRCPICIYGRMTSGMCHCLVQSKEDALIYHLEEAHFPVHCSKCCEVYQSMRDVCFGKSCAEMRLCSLFSDTHLVSPFAGATSTPMHGATSTPMHGAASTPMHGATSTPMHNTNRTPHATPFGKHKMRLGVPTPERSCLSRVEEDSEETLFTTAPERLSVNSQSRSQSTEIIFEDAVDMFFFEANKRPYCEEESEELRKRKKMKLDGHKSCRC